MTQENLPPLPPLLPEHANSDVLLVPLGEESYQTPIVNLEGILKGASSAPSSPEDTEWFATNIELPVRTAVHTLIASGVATIESGANRYHVGQSLEETPGFISISLTHTPQASHLTERAKIFHQGLVDRGASPQEEGCDIVVLDEENNVAKQIMILKVAVKDTDTAGDVSARFDALTAFLLADK